MRHVLDGYKVLDFTQVLAGPSCTRLLVEMGAEVIKIELPPNGDPSRALPALRNNRSAYYIQQNRGKKSVCVDPKTPAGLEILLQLVEKVDVLVENFAPGVLGRLGLGWNQVHLRNPRLVMCSISAFGQTGPLSALPGFDYIAQAYAAVTHMIGEPDGPPMIPMLGIGDVLTGSLAMGAIVAALLYRDRTGSGQYLDVSILDSYFQCHEMNVQVYSASGGTVQPKRTGAHHPHICPSGVFRGKDGYFIIMAFMDHHWRELCHLMGRPELADDPRFATNAERLKHVDLVVALIEGWLASQESDDVTTRLLHSHRIPAAPVISIAEAVAHPHHRERGTVRTIGDRIFGDFEAPGFPLRFSAFPEPLPLEAPFLGEHNEEVLSQHLGYSRERIQALEREGVLRRGER